MKRAALGAAFVTMVLVLLARTSAAQSKSSAGAPAYDSESVSLLYEDSPPADCPTQAEFEAEVTKLTSKAHFTQQRRARRVRIELANSGHDIVGRFISGDGKNQASREVRGKDCHEVASALSIAVALTIDPEALGLVDTEPEPAPPPPEPTPAAPPPKKAASGAPSPPQPPGPPPHAPTKIMCGVGAGLELESAFAPQMRPGGHLFGQLAVGERFRAALGLTRFLTRQVDDVSFGAWLAEGQLSVNLALLGGLRPFAGVGFEVGAVDAAGNGLPAIVQAQRPWQAGSAGLGLRFETDGFFVQLGGCLLVPLSRQRYLISDQFGEVRTFYEVPRIGLKQETSLGVFL